uniref:MBOAT family protein n=1 Tax=Prevotella sp. GTC17262 TaxID=3236797 RepID=A0AB33JI93_9BACT
MFTKMCVADILVSYTDAVFNNLSNHNAPSILFATILYTFQIYADFNGYSNMAIGTAQILGIRGSENFSRPYFADSVSDFWRRWHISLSSWIKDYIYIPLGGNRKGKYRMFLNQLIAMTLCGMWHGASLTFIVWGGIHGVLVCIHKLWSQYILGHDRHYHPNGFNRVVSILLTFVIVSLVWQLFRINSMSDYLILLEQTGKWGSLFLNDPHVFTFGLLSTIIMMFKDFNDEFATRIHFIHSKSISVRLVSIALLICYIVLFGALDGKTFIYFQF